MRTRLLRPLALVLLVTFVIGLPAGAQTLDDIQERLRQAQEQREGIEERIAEATVAFDALQTQIAELEQDRDQLDSELAALRGELADLDALVTFRVRETFKHGQTLDPIAVFLSTDDPTAALSRAQTVQRVVSADRARSEDLTAVRTAVGAAEERLEVQVADLEAAQTRQQEVNTQLQEDFARVQELEEQLTEEERAERDRLERERRERERLERERQERERQAREQREAQAREQAARERRNEQQQREQESSASTGDDSSAAPEPAPAPPAPAPSGGGMVCPLDQPRHFIDSWGHSRSGGRGHRGTDLMGPRGIPVRAITSGVWSIQSPGASAGLWAILRGDNGDHYWYMHLDSHTVANGTRVSAGQQVGTNGSTGNASAGAEHVHFEHHPGGGGAINPYPLLRNIC